MGRFWWNFWAIFGYKKLVFPSQKRSFYTIVFQRFMIGFWVGLRLGIHQKSFFEQNQPKIAENGGRNREILAGWANGAKPGRAVELRGRG